MTVWSDSGYDLSIGDRWLYGFASPERGWIKVGLVLSEKRLVPRLGEVRRRSGFHDLAEVWRAPLRNISHEEAEHVESAVRLWLARSAGFRFVGAVDWLAMPIGLPPDDLVSQCDEAVVRAVAFGT